MEQWLWMNEEVVEVEVREAVEVVLMGGVGWNRAAVFADGQLHHHHSSV